MMVEYMLEFLLLLLIVLAVYLVYERFSGRTKEPEPSLYLEALRDLLDGRQEAAFSKLRQVVAEDGSNLDAYLRLGRILRENNQPERAYQVHKDLTLRPGLSRPERSAILREIAADCLALNDLNTAETALKEQVELNPEDHWAHSRLLSLQEKAQQWDAAYDTAVTILKLEGDKSKKPLARYKFQLGEMLYRQREYHKARIAYKEAIGLDPAHVSAYLAIGDSYYEEKRLEDAVTFWNKLTTAVPDQGHLAIDRLKRTLYELGRFGEVPLICEQILEHSPKNLEARRALAEFYENKGDVDLAIEMWERILDDNPDDGAAVLDLIRVHLERRDYSRISSLIRNLEKRREQLSRRMSTGASESVAHGA
ncbi:MAG: tetratricopeptide repeat protein [Candidatus Zixiibacteriota bacterium]